MQEIISIIPTAIILTIFVKFIWHKWNKRHQYITNIRVLLVDQNGVYYAAVTARRVKVTWEIQQILNSHLLDKQDCHNRRGYLLIVERWERNLLPPMAFPQNYEPVYQCISVREDGSSEQINRQVIVIQEEPLAALIYEDIVGAEVKAGTSPDQKDKKFRDEVNLLSWVGAASLVVNLIVKVLL